MSPFLGGIFVSLPTSAVDNIDLHLLSNNSSYEDGMLLFIGVVLYIYNVVYEHFFSSWACFQRALIVLIALSATLVMVCFVGVVTFPLKPFTHVL